MPLLNWGDFTPLQKMTSINGVTEVITYNPYEWNSTHGYNWCFYLHLIYFYSWFFRGPPCRHPSTAFVGRKGQDCHTVAGRKFHGAIVGPRQRGRHHRCGTRKPRPGAAGGFTTVETSGAWWRWKPLRPWMRNGCLDGSFFGKFLQAGPRADGYKWAVFFSRLSRVTFFARQSQFFFRPLKKRSHFTPFITIGSGPALEMGWSFRDFFKTENW